MCVISGGVGITNIIPDILCSLKTLNRDGCDSAGIATFNAGEKLKRIRVVGTVDDLCSEVIDTSFAGTLAISHVRKATHGIPCIKNAHPQFAPQLIGIVHNGFIDNYTVLKEYLHNRGYVFSSDTDTEVIVHLIHHYAKMTSSFSEAVALAVFKLKGEYSIAAISDDTPNELVISCQGSPLYIGVSENENFFTSELSMLRSKNTVALSHGDVASIKANRIIVFDKDRHITNR